MTELEKISLEFVKFMRGKYRLDEVAGMYYEIPCLKFCQGKKTIVSVNIHKDYYDIQIVLGKAEQEKFDAIRDELPIEMYWQKGYFDYEEHSCNWWKLFFRKSFCEAGDFIRT